MAPASPAPAEEPPERAEPAAAEPRAGASEVEGRPVKENGAAGDALAEAKAGVENEEERGGPGRHGRDKRNAARGRESASPKADVARTLDKKAHSTKSEDAIFVDPGNEDDDRIGHVNVVKKDTTDNAKTAETQKREAERNDGDPGEDAAVARAPDQHVKEYHEVTTQTGVSESSDRTKTKGAVEIAVDEKIPLSSKRGLGGDSPVFDTISGTKQLAGHDKKRRVADKGSPLLEDVKTSTLPSTPPPVSSKGPSSLARVAKADGSRPCCSLGQVPASWWEPFRRVQLSIEGGSDASLERDARLLLSMAGIVESLQLRESQSGLAGFAIFSRVSEAIMAAEICHEQHLAQGDAELFVHWAQGHDINTEDLHRVIVTFGQEDPAISLDWVTDNIGEATGRNQAIEDCIYFRFSHLAAIGSVRTLLANNEVPSEQEFGGVAVINFLKPSGAQRAVEDWANRGAVLSCGPAIRCLHSLGDIFLASLGTDEVPQHSGKLAPLNKRTRSASPTVMMKGTSSAISTQMQSVPSGESATFQVVEASLHQPKRSKATAAAASSLSNTSAPSTSPITSTGDETSRSFRHQSPRATSRTLLVRVPNGSRDAVQHFVKKLPGFEYIDMPSPTSTEACGRARFTSAAAAESAARSLDKLKIEDQDGKALKLEWSAADAGASEKDVPTTTTTTTSATSSGTSSSTNSNNNNNNNNNNSGPADVESVGAAALTSAPGASDTRKRRTKERENESDRDREQPAPKHQATEAGQTTRHLRANLSSASDQGPRGERRLGSNVAHSFSTSSLRRGRPRPASTGRDNARRRVELEREREREASNFETNEESADRLADNFRSAVAFSSSASTSSTSSSSSPSPRHARERGASFSARSHFLESSEVNSHSDARSHASANEAWQRREASDANALVPARPAAVVAGSDVFTDDSMQRYDPNIQYAAAAAAAAAASMHHPPPHMYHPQVPPHPTPGYSGYHPAANMIPHGPPAQGPGSAPPHYYVHPQGHPHGAGSIFNPAMAAWASTPYGQGVPGYPQPSGVPPGMPAPSVHSHMATPASTGMPPSTPPPATSGAAAAAMTPIRVPDAHHDLRQSGSTPGGGGGGGGGGLGKARDNGGVKDHSSSAGVPRPGGHGGNGTPVGQTSRPRKDRHGHGNGSSAPASTANGNTSAPLETSRLYVSFSRPLPEDVLKEKFEQAAPGLEYVSRHNNKCFAFVKYSAEDAARLAMWRLNGAEVLEQTLRVSIAQPPRAGPGGHGSGSASSSSRKRQRTLDPDQHHRK